MKYTTIGNAKEGQVLGRSIYSVDGKVLLREGVTLSKTVILKLKQLGISAIYIKDQRFSDVEVEDIVSEGTKRATMGILSESVKCIQTGKGFDMKEIQKNTNDLIDEILKNRDNLVFLGDILTKDNQLFIHSVNVGIISTIIGVNLQMSRTQLQELVIGALFHDIGKVVPDEALDKLTLKDPNVTEHTWRGFYYLKKKPEINTVSSIVALQHHEFINGQGYPRGLKNEEIHLYAKIVGLANYYENLIYPKEGSIGLKPHVALEKVMGLSNRYFEHDIVWKFLRSIAAYPNGSAVRLSNNEYGIVVGQHKGLPSRPIIRLLSEQNPETIISKEIDLAIEKTIFIEEVLD